MNKNLTIELTHKERGKLIVYYSDVARAIGLPCWIAVDPVNTGSYYPNEFEETEAEVSIKWHHLAAKLHDTITILMQGINENASEVEE